MNENLEILNKDKSKELVIRPFKHCNGVRFTINDKTYSEIEITNKQDVINIMIALNKVIEDWQ